MAAASERGAVRTTELQMQNTSFDKRVLSENPSQFSTDPAPAKVPSHARAVAARRNLHELVAWTRQSCVRELWDWARCKQVTRSSAEELSKSIAALSGSGRISEENETDAPIFLLATGWRSGSTLLQRILVTDPNVLLWGEPLGEMALVSGLASMLTRLSSFPGLKERCAVDDRTFSSLATSWIATLYPPGNDFRLALQTLFNQWLGEPARHRGFSRWGFKEVRLGAAEATLLHWLYPNAKFVLLSRNPYDCYRSLSDSGWHHVYHTRPDIRVDSAAGLARHWNRVALSWSELPRDFPAFHIKYEDLIGGNVDFRRLESWLGIEIREDVALAVFVGRTARRHRLGWCERLIISHEAAAGMRELGYSEEIEK
jgi:Sulfotransferase family